MSFAVLLLLSAPAAAPAATPPAPEKKICRRDTGIGSRLDVKRTCKTAAEWAAYNKAVEMAGDKRQDTRTIGLNGR